jgi:hypothetical protein
MKTIRKNIKSKKTLKNKSGKYVVYTRSYYEDPYLNFFIEHYVKLGFDLIIILINNLSKYKCPKIFQKYVKLIRFKKNLGDDLLPKYDYLVKKKKEYDWIFSCDNDEFLFLDKKYDNIKDFVQQKIYIEPNINMFYFRWGMIEKGDNKIFDNFNDILDEYPIYIHSRTKSMFKSSHLKTIINPHFPLLYNYHIYFEGSVHSNFMMKKNEHNTSKHPLKFNSYKESVLVHFHTRSLNNIIMKVFTSIYHYILTENNSKLINLFNNKKKIDLNNFLDLIGPKINCAISPYLNASKCDNLIHNKLEDKNKEHWNFTPQCYEKYNLEPSVNISKMKRYNYNYKPIDEISENKVLINILKYNNIEPKMYFYHIKYIEKDIKTLISPN